MTLQKFFENRPQGSKAKMAEDLGITRAWLSMIISGAKLPSAALAVAISHYTKNKVSRKSLRPDIFE